jgi:hypothetical protein
LVSDSNNEVLICFNLVHIRQKEYRFRLFGIWHSQELPYTRLLSVNVNLDIYRDNTRKATFHS